MTDRGAEAPADDRARRILDLRTAQLAARRSRPADPQRPGRPVLACRVGPEVYGLDLATVAGVLPMRPCTVVPGSPAALIGLFGRAGRLVAALELGAVLGRPTDSAGQSGHLVLLRHGRAIALRVDRALGAAALAFSPAGESGERGEGLVTGHARAPAGTLDRDETLVAMLDPDRLSRLLSTLHLGA